MRWWETKFIALLNLEERSDKRDDDCLRCSLLLRTAATAGRKVVLIVLICDISGDIWWERSRAYVCSCRYTHKHTQFLLQKHTDNLYLCVQTVGFSPRNMRIHANSRLERHECMFVLALNRHHGIKHTRRQNSTAIERECSHVSTALVQQMHHHLVTISRLLSPPPPQNSRFGRK